jgi:cysteine desulfurase
MKPPVYLDYNATTPLDPEVVEAMRPYLEHNFGNPSSSHEYGKANRQAVENAREQVAALLGCAAGEIIFTSGGTEANNHAIKGVAAAMRDRGRHMVTTKVEHPAVIEACRFLAAFGFETTYLPVDGLGMVSPTDVKRAIRPDTVLVSIMHANNEVGTIQPIAEIAEITKNYGVILHTDAAQSIGKIAANVDQLGVDLLSIAGHKVYAPKGVGALYIRHPLKIEKLLHGAGQEMGRRAGTENVLEIVGLGKACQLAAKNIKANMKHMRLLRDRLHSGLDRRLSAIKLNGHPDQRLPNTLNLSFKGMAATQVLEDIGSLVAASAGAACHSDTVEVSHVIQAMGIPLDWAKGTLRFSVGRMTTAEEIDRAVDVITEAVSRLKNNYTLP